MFGQDKVYDALLSYTEDTKAWSEALRKRLKKAGARVLRGKPAQSPAEYLSTWLKRETPNCHKLIVVCGEEILRDPRMLESLESFREKASSRLASERPLIPVLRGGSLPGKLNDLLPVDFSCDEDFELRLRQLVEALDLPAEEEPGILRKISNIILSKWLKQKSEPRQQRFHEDVAEIYRLLGFEVRFAETSEDTPPIFTIEKREGRIPTKAIVECFDRQIDAEVCNQVIGRHRQTPACNRSVITSEVITEEVKNLLKPEDGIYCTPYFELLLDLVPLRDYAETLIKEEDKRRAENWKGKDWFIRPDVITDKKKTRGPAVRKIAQWLGAPEARHLVVLGDLGTGKTTLAYYLAYEMARAFRADPLRHPAPVLIELLTKRAKVDLQGIITSNFSSKNLVVTDFKRFERLVKSGRIVLIFDAFDEMADRLREDEMQHNLAQMLEPAKSGGKVMLTCRTHHFKDHREQVEKLGHDSEALYLTDFAEDQVKRYLDLARPTTSDSDWNLIGSTYNLKELIRRPLFMDWFVKSADDLIKGDAMDSAKFYSRYVKRWADRERDKARVVVSEAKIGVMMELARWMWDDERQSIHHRELSVLSERLVAGEKYDFGGEGTEEVAGEMRTASFLKRDTDGYFSFADDSFREYFFARLLHSSLTEPDGNPPIRELLNTHLLSEKIVLFLAFLDGTNLMRQPLWEILMGDYVPRVSENALQILYWSGRTRCGMEKRVDDPGKLRGVFATLIPPGANLAGADLRSFSLEAIDLNGADFNGADLSGANLNYARINNTTFRSANLTGVKLENVNAFRADFHEAVISQARIISSHLVECDFVGTIHHDVVFGFNELAGTRGLSAIGGVQKIDLRPVVQLAHAGGVNAVACSRDGKLCASGGIDGLIVLSRISDGRLLRVIDAHVGRVNSVHFSPNSAYLASGGEDRFVRLWSVREGELIRTFEGHNEAVRAVRFSHDGQTIASGSDDRNLRLWAAGSGLSLRVFSAHTGGVNSVHFSEDGNRLVSGSDDCSVRIWDLASGHPEKTEMPKHDHARVNCVRFSPDGKLVAGGGDDGVVRLWRSSDGKLKRVLEAHTGPVRSIQFSRDGRHLVSSGNDHIARVWSVADGKMLRKLEGHVDVVESVRFSPDDKLIISGGYDRSVRIWQVSNGECLRVIEGHKNSIRSMYLSTDGTVLVSGGDDFRLHVWSNNGHNLLHVLSGHTARVTTVHISPDGTQLASGGNDRCVRLWNLLTGSEDNALLHRGEVTSVRFSTNGKFLASASADHSVRLWSAITGELLHVLGGERDNLIASGYSANGHKDRVNSVRFSPDDRLLASGGDDKKIRLWSVENRQLLHTFEIGHQDAVTSLEFSQDGNLLASGSRDRSLRLWEVPTGKIVRTFNGQKRRISAVRFSPDGQLLAGGSWDGSVHLWSVSDGKFQQPLEGHQGPVNTISFSPTGRYLIAAGAAGRLQVWDVESGRTVLFRYRFGADAWLDLLPDGRFDANDAGRRYLCYTEHGEINSHIAELMQKDFHAPEAVRALVRGIQTD